jgi:hypothetical protein
VETVNDIEGRRPDREDRIAPNEVELIKYRTSQTTLQFRVVTGELLEGKIRWYDDLAIRIVQPDKSELTLFRQSLVYYKTRS